MDWIFQELQAIGEPFDLVGHNWDCLVRQSRGYRQQAEYAEKQVESIFGREVFFYLVASRTACRSQRWRTFRSCRECQIMR